MSAGTTDQHNRRIATALARLNAAAAGRPGFGCTTSTSESTLAGALSCSTRERSWEIESDLSTAFGGDGSAPSPSTLLRAALSACLAMGYRLRAAERGIELTAVRVTVEAESDIRGMLDPDASAPPGDTGLRYHVEIESPAPAHEVQRVIELGDRLSPVLDMLTRPHAIARTVTIAPSPSRPGRRPGADRASASHLLPAQGRDGARAPKESVA